MNEMRITKARLIVNGIGCLGIALLCLPVGISGLFGLVFGAHPLASDPDGGDKVLAIQMVCVLLGAIAVISLMRTVKRWRALHRGNAA